MVQEWASPRVDVDEAPICERSQETELVCCAHVLSRYVQANIEINFSSDGIDSPFRCRTSSTKSETPLAPWRSASVTRLFSIFNSRELSVLIQSRG